MPRNTICWGYLSQVDTPISYFATPKQVVVGLIALSGILVTLIQMSSTTVRLGPRLSGGITIMLVLVWLFVGLYFYQEYPSLIYERCMENVN